MKDNSILKDKSFWIKCFLVVFIMLIMIPAFFSTLYYYNPEKYKSLAQDYYLPDSDQIILNSNYTFSLRHELCHRDFREKDLNIFVEEMICYAKMWFFWNKVNLTTLDYER